MDFAVGLWRWRLDVLLEERCEPTGMLFGHMGDLSLQDDCNWTLSEDVRTEVNLLLCASVCASSVCCQFWR